MSDNLLVLLLIIGALQLVFLIAFPVVFVLISIGILKSIHREAEIDAGLRDKNEAQTTRLPGKERS